MINLQEEMLPGHGGVGGGGEGSNPRPPDHQSEVHPINLFKRHLFNTSLIAFLKAVVNFFFLSGIKMLKAQLSLNIKQVIGWLVWH